MKRFIVCRRGRTLHRSSSHINAAIRQVADRLSKTLQDVAEVSLGSASRALSNPGLVKPKTLKRVMQAVAQLGYVRNGVARALASRRTFSAVAVYPTMHKAAFADSIH